MLLLATSSANTARADWLSPCRRAVVEAGWCLGRRCCRCHLPLGRAQIGGKRIGRQILRRRDGVDLALEVYKAGVVGHPRGVDGAVLVAVSVMGVQAVSTVACCPAVMPLVSWSRRR